MFRLENGKLARLDPAAFRKVIRMVDQGLPIDAARIRERTETMLAVGPLLIQKGEGAIVINGGQARVQSNPSASGGELALAGGLTLADGELEARLQLSGPPGPGAPANTEPSVVVALKGPVQAPIRTLDVTAFASWLALRAVEQQARKLDALEGREEPRTSSPLGSGAATEGATVPAPAAVAPAAAPAADVEGARGRGQPASSNGQPKRAPAAERTPTSGPSVPPAAPPPIDLRPRTPPGAAKSQPAPPPARPRSLSEILFGR
jgi:large subunit ribosomal protein L24